MTTVQSNQLEFRGTPVADTYAEAFPIVGTRLIITADSMDWARIAGQTVSGYATSVIACDAEAAIERELTAAETPDARPGVSVLFFGFKRESVEKAVISRVGQCVLTAPTTACFDGLPGTPADRQIAVGKQIRFFGDGFQASKKLGSRRFWRIPVMDGEFVCEDRVGTIKGVAGGNLLIAGRTAEGALRGAEAAVRAIRDVRDVIMPFPGGIVRSGSKVGSRYKGLKASTNDAYCPTLRAQTASELPRDAAAVYEIVIDGLSYEAVKSAMRVGLQAAAVSPEICLITAGNYGGKLGPHLFPLRELLSEETAR